MKLWPSNVVFGDKDMPLIQVEYKGERKGWSKEFIVVEISSMILVKMKMTSEAYLGRDVEDVVITICWVDFLCVEFRQP